MSIKDYIEEAAEGKPTPGGGSISALSGALAATMGEMAGNFTAGKEKFSDVEERVKTCLKRLNLARNKLLNLADADAEAYSGVNAAYKLPRETSDEKQRREAEIQKALRDAMRVPLNVMRQCASVAETAAELVDIANPNLLTDVAVCAVLAEAACAAAEFNVRINLKYIDDPEVGHKTESEVEEYITTASNCRDEVTAKVNRQFE
jgi:formiminotetrahydrofolate cyclodeaminase